MTVQDLQFALIEQASFNSFDGSAVVASLKAHPGLWRGAIMKRDDLIPLRDIPNGYWNVDTLYILPVLGKESELEELASEWNADEISWLGGEQACGALGSYSPEGRANPRAVLSIWWD